MDARPRGLGWSLVAVAVALGAASGCEETPTTPEATGSPSLTVGTSAKPSPDAAATGTASPTPGVSPSSLRPSQPPASPSPAPLASPTTVVRTPSPSPSLRPSPSPTPSPSPSPGASPTPTPSPSPSPSPNFTPAEVSFELPLPSQDFTANSVPIRVRADVVSGVTVRSMAVRYDNSLLSQQVSSSRQLSISNWNPNVVNNVGTRDEAPQRQGSHVLVATVTTVAGVETTRSFPFEKPFLFRGWGTTYVREAGGSFNLPPLPTGRTQLHLTAAGTRLFAIFGEGEGGAASGNVLTLNLEAPTPLWVERGFPTLLARSRAGYADQGERVFMAGGLVNGVATNRVQAFDLLQQRTFDLPNLPQALVAPALAVGPDRLYVMGGSTNGSNATVRTEVYALNLLPSGAFGTSWSTLAPLNLTAVPAQAQGRQNAAAVFLGGEIWLLGGEGSVGALDSVWRYRTDLNQWSLGGLLPTAATGLKAKAFQNRIWAFGGQSGGSSPLALRDAIRLQPGNPARIEGVSMAGLPERRSAFGLAMMQDPRLGDRLVVMGGHDLSATGAVLPRSNGLLSDTL